MQNRELMEVRLAERTFGLHSVSAPCWGPHRWLFWPCGPQMPVGRRSLPDRLSGPRGARCLPGGSSSGLDVLAAGILLIFTAAGANARVLPIAVRRQRLQVESLIPARSAICQHFPELLDAAKISHFIGRLPFDLGSAPPYIPPSRRPPGVTILRAASLLWHNGSSCRRAAL